MADLFLRQSALSPLALEAEAAHGPGHGTLELCERAPRAQIALRGDAGDDGFSAAVEAVLGVAPPRAANTVARRREVTVLWLGPDEWLAVMPAGREAKAMAALESGLASHHALVSDVSHARGVIGIAGEHAREVLSKGCAIDLHPRVFGPGRCAQTRLARCHMLLHQTTAVPAFDVYVHRSFMVYAWTWLRDAAGEHGVSVVSGQG